MNPQTIVLLDLNFTLASNSDERMSWWQSGDLREEYRQWLVDWLVRIQARVFLVTARPDYLKARTIERIREITGWEPERYYFKDRQSEQAHEYKERVLTTILRPEFPTAEFIGLESNKATRARYAKQSVDSAPIGDPENLVDHLHLQVSRWQLEHVDARLAVTLAHRSKRAFGVQKIKKNLDLPFGDLRQNEVVTKRLQTGCRENGSLYTDESVKTIAVAIIEASRDVD